MKAQAEKAVHDFRWGYVDSACHGVWILTSFGGARYEIME